MANKTHKYITIFQKAPEGGFTVTVPHLPGCISEGGTFEEAERNIKEAIELYLETISGTSEGSRSHPETSEAFAVSIQV